MIFWMVLSRIRSGNLMHFGLIWRCWRRRMAWCRGWWFCCIWPPCAWARPVPGKGYRWWEWTLVRSLGCTSSAVLGCSSGVGRLWLSFGWGLWYFRPRVQCLQREGSNQSQLVPGQPRLFRKCLPQWQTLTFSAFLRFPSPYCPLQKWPW